MLDKIDGRLDTIKLDEDFANSHDMSRFHEWTKISLGKCTVEDNITMLTRFRIETPFFSPHTDGNIGGTMFDTLSIFAFLEFLLPIQYLIFSPAPGTLVPDY